MLKSLYIIVLLFVFAFLPIQGNAVAQTLQSNDIRSAIERFKNENGYAITEDDWISLMKVHKVPLTELGQYLELIRKQQIPKVTISQLIAISQARQNSITSITAKWRFVSENKINATTADYLHTFTLSKKRVLFETIHNNTETVDVAMRRIASYDGEVVRLVDIPLSESSQYETNAFLSNFESYESYFIASDNILWLTMLLDSKQYGFPENLSSDLLSFLRDDKLRVIVFEHMQKFQGTDCYVVSGGPFRVYLDPQYQYAVVGLESYAMDTISENGKRYYNGVKLRHRRVLSDMKDYGNGVFLPSKIISQWYSRDNGTLEVQVTIDIQSIEINKDYDKEYFSDIIPDDAMVADGINNLVYRQNDRDSINALLQETAKSKRVWTLQIISVTVGILMILIWIVIQHLAYRKSKNSQ